VLFLFHNQYCVLQTGCTPLHNQYCVLQTGCTPLHKAAYVGARDCLTALLRHGGDLAAESSTNMSVMDIIFSHLPRPLHFLTDILNGSIIPNGASVNDRSFKVSVLNGSLLYHSSAL
jgi:ankyrin repeat protein